MLNGNLTTATNATVLEAELDWFYRVLDTRLKLQFGHHCDFAAVEDVTPPPTDSETMYGNFVSHYRLNFAERVVFVLALVPHLRPQLLDVFFARNGDNNRAFTEFGGHRGQGGYQGFQPTGETALFLLAGEDLGRRFALMPLFAADHFFSRHAIVTLEPAGRHEPFLSGILTLSREIIDLVTTGAVRKPIFSVDFPAKRLETAITWGELILDPHTMAQVMEIRTWMEHGETLLTTLGLGRKLKPGYRSLFHGPPGTGKTLTATLLGKVTDRDVYRIDLSLVVSKYIGETEKNLEKIFQQAEHKEWILFFDEADALFGKRTSINDAHDRFANQEVSYLLQRVEDYPGVVILASNMRDNLDDAFTRRFQSIIHFPMPKAADRLQLWRNGLARPILLADDLDLGEIASQYELSGGAIMNVVRYASLMMLAHQGQAISRNDLLDGIRKEFQKEGRTM